MQEGSLEDLTEEIRKLRQRVQTMEDREAIRDLTASYMQAMHDARWEDALECFAEEAEYDHGLLGELHRALHGAPRQDAVEGRRVRRALQFPHDGRGCLFYLPLIRVTAGDGAFG